MTKTIMAAVLAAATFVPPSAHAQSAVPSGKGIPTISAQERADQDAWWAARASRLAATRIACMAMPDCGGRRMMSAASSNKG